MVWTLAGEEIVGIRASDKNLSSVAISPDAKILATSGLGDDISLWSLPSGDLVGRLSGHETAVWSLTFVDGGRSLVSLGYEQTIRFWDAGTWNVDRTLRADTSGVRGLAFAPDERTVALSMEGKVQLWSVSDWALQAELPVSTKVVNGMAFSPDGRWLAVGAADRRIRVWAL
jgi:WD40 repeat protein